MAPSYVDDRYRKPAKDPEQDDGWYEERKHALILASLPSRRHRRAFEPGCSLGTLTRLLSERCDEILAADAAESSVAATTAQCRDALASERTHLMIPVEWPQGDFDLIVINEVGNQLSPASLTALIERCVQTLAGGGALLAAHCRRPDDGSSLTGDEVHTVLRADGRTAR